MDSFPESGTLADDTLRHWVTAASAVLRFDLKMLHLEYVSEIHFSFQQITCEHIDILKICCYFDLIHCRSGVEILVVIDSPNS